MGLYIDLSQAGHGQPFDATACQTLQYAYSKADEAQVIAQIGSSYDPTKVYILYGCVLSSSAGTTTVTAGQIFYNGFIYEVVSTSYADPSGGTPVSVANIFETYLDGTGTIFADGFIKNVLVSQQVKFAAGASGSGTLSTSSASDYTNLIGTSTSAWRTSVAPTFTAVGVGSISGGTVVYNKYRIVGKTLNWQCKLLNATITGSPINIELKSPITPLGIDFPAPMKMTAIYNDGTNDNIITCGLNGGTIGNATVYLQVPAGSFTAGVTNQTFYINVTAELP